MAPAAAVPSFFSSECWVSGITAGLNLESVDSTELQTPSHIIMIGIRRRKNGLGETFSRLLWV